jgi:radical SAM protein with 4Fe4S-binding SPASM domain
MTETELSTSRADDLISEISMLKPGWVIVEGGEPLLRDDLSYLLSRMVEKGLRIHIITNGMLIDRELLPLFRDSGIRVMVSIDGATRATYRRIRSGADFDTVLKSASIYSEHGLLEALNFTILKSNLRQIPAIFRLAKRIGALKINFIGFKPCHEFQQEIPSPSESAQAIRLVCESSRKTGVDVFFDEPYFRACLKKWDLAAPLQGENSGILLSSISGCILGDYLFIDPDGNVKPCSFASLTSGNVNRQSLNEIWTEICASEFLSRLKDPSTRTGICSSCSFLAECKGCRSRTFILTNDWFAADPCCPLQL